MCGPQLIYELGFLVMFEKGVGPKSQGLSVIFT